MGEAQATYSSVRSKVLVDVELDTSDSHFGPIVSFLNSCSPFDYTLSLAERDGSKFKALTN